MSNSTDPPPDATCIETGCTLDAAVGARFEARHGGRCPWCDNGFREGDTVGYLDEDVCCGSCHGKAKAYR